MITTLVTPLLLLIFFQLTSIIYFGFGFLKFDKISNSINFNSNQNLKFPILEQTIQAQLKKFEDKLKTPIYDRLVFFVIDAWRWDFIFSPNTPMQFIKQ
jgi:hypothetical protein